METEKILIKNATTATDCCSTDGDDYSHGPSHDDGQNHSSPEKVSNFKTYIPAIFSFVMLLAGLAIDYFEVFPFFEGWVRLVWYGVAYLPVGLPVIKEGWESIKNGEFFTEFLLMSIATCLLY